MNMLKKIIIANLFGLIVPFAIYSLVKFTGAYDNVVIASIYIAIFLIPLFLLLVLFREDSIMQGYPHKTVLWRTLSACMVWVMAMMLSSKYFLFIDTKVIPLLATRLFDNLVLPPLIPAMTYKIPMYTQMFTGLAIVYCAIFLNLSIVISHCPPGKTNELSSKNT